MHHTTQWAAAALLCMLLLALDATAQQRPVLSPRDSVFLSLDTNVISVNYSRPSMRGRKIMGELVPWDKVWRTGANLATHLKTSFDMTLGGVPVPRGTYTLWTLPSMKGWKIIINKQTGQWGTSYDERQDLARFDAKVESPAALVDTFTVALQATGKTSGVLKLMWENTLVLAPFEKNDRIRPISPLDSTEVTLKGKKIKASYSRPYVRGRSIWGVIVPFDSVWRTGANSATLLTTGVDLVVGTTTVPKGTYTLYSVPAANGLTLIISKKPGGMPAYDPAMDQIRVPMEQTTPSSAVDPFRIWFEPAKKNSVLLRLGWSDRVYSVTLKAK
jgi:hypothetical protein